MGHHLHTHHGYRGFGWLPRWGPRRNFTRVVRAFLARKILCWLYMDFLGKPLRKFGVCNWWWNGGLENEFSPHSNGFTKPLESSHFGQSSRTHIICFLYGSTLRQWDPMPNENWYSMVACQFGYFMKVPFLKWNNYFKTVRRALTKMHESNTFLAGKSQKELATVESFTKLWVFNRAARVSRFPFACQPPPSKWSRRATRTMGTLLFADGSQKCLAAFTVWIALLVTWKAYKNMIQDGQVVQLVSSMLVLPTTYKATDAVSSALQATIGKIVKQNADSRVQVRVGLDLWPLTIDGLQQSRIGWRKQLWPHSRS